MNSRIIKTLLIAFFVILGIAITWSRFDFRSEEQIELDNAITKISNQVDETNALANIISKRSEAARLERTYAEERLKATKGQKGLE